MGASTLMFQLVLVKEDEKYSMGSMIMFHDTNQWLPSYGDFFVIDGHKYRFATDKHLSLDSTASHTAYVTHTKMAEVIRKMAAAEEIKLGIISTYNGLNADIVFEVSQEDQTNLKEMCNALLESNFLAHFSGDNSETAFTEEDDK